MPWHDIHGHDLIAALFRQALRQGRVANTYLFVGPTGIGKKTFALMLTKSLLCERTADDQLDACGRCVPCQQVQAGTHPDVQIIQRPRDKSFIPLELLIGRKEHRLREGLCHSVALKPRPGSRKIAIIDDADDLNREGANCLLKTLEEPPPRSVIILISTSQQRQLPTIRSRSQIVRFHPLPDELVVKLLLDHGHVADEALAHQLAKLSEGSYSLAVDLAEAEFWEFRSKFLGTLSHADWNTLELTHRLGEFVNAAGSEATHRRARLQKLIAVAVEFYRQLMRAVCRADVRGDNELRQAVSTAAAWWQFDAEVAADCAQRCMEASAHVDANANQATLLACWVDDLAMLSRAGQVALT